MKKTPFSEVCGNLTKAAEWLQDGARSKPVFCNRTVMFHRSISEEYATGWCYGCDKNIYRRLVDYVTEAKS